jgi:5-methyltetrahydrofolate--homocysteine methyltransferase
MEELKELVKSGKAQETAARVESLLDKGIAPETIMREALIPAMDEVGDLFQRGDYYVPEMMVAARAMQHGLDVIRPKLVASGVEPVGKVVMGTVKGDLHDIGKKLVVMALEGAGLEVIDLGADVSAESFVAAIKEHGPDVLGLSALLTTTMLAMKDIVDSISRAGLRDQVRIMVGGAPLRKEFADEIGADFYGKDATAGRNFARLVAAERTKRR